MPRAILPWAIGFLSLLAGLGSAAAHDLWLVPPERPAVGAPVRVRANVGMDFPNSEHAPDPAAFSRRLLIRPDGSPGELRAAGKDGLSGLVEFTPAQTGVYVLAVETKPRLITLAAGKFNDYLVADGLPHIYRLRAREKTLDQPGRERYSKYVKALVRVGDGRAGDPCRVAGLTLEIVPQRDPFAVRPGQALPVRVLFRGKPLAEANVGWQRPGDGAMARGYVRTDAHGEALIPIAGAGLMTIRLTHMTRPKAADHEWESFWATLTFHVPDGPTARASARQERIVFVGDSITDGHTYPQLVRQALADAGLSPPVCINGGIAGDTAAGMRKRLERDVLSHRPTLVTFSAGINDVLRKVSPADYETEVTAVAEQLKAARIPLLILTTSILGPKHAGADKRLDEFNAALVRVAKKFGCRVADVNRLMQEARGAGRAVLEEDQVHPNWEGQRLIARAMLDALGHKEAAVPRSLRLGVLPGVIRAWRIQAVPAKGKPASLDEQAVRGLKPDESWKAHTLPEQERQAQWWLDQERQRGFALSLKKVAGPAQVYRGLAILNSPKPRTVYFNTGAHLESIWLNGKRIFRSAGWTGWHAGKQRIAAELRPGENVVVIETGEHFFLSVTEERDW
jgi:lysophospholipase L1-like esterase